VLVDQISMSPVFYVLFPICHGVMEAKSGAQGRIEELEQTSVEGVRDDLCVDTLAKSAVVDVSETTTNTTTEPISEQTDDVSTVEDLVHSVEEIRERRLTGLSQGHQIYFDKLVRYAFTMWDLDHDGVLTRSEMENSVQRFGLHPEHTARAFHQTFQRKNGMMYAEFAAAVSS